MPPDLYTGPHAVEHWVSPTLFVAPLCVSYYTNYGPELFTITHGISAGLAVVWWSVVLFSHGHLKIGCALIYTLKN